MTPQQANELLPCAHCAGKAELFNMSANTPRQYWMAACECGIQYEGPTTEDCTEMWNRRAPAPTSEPGARDAEMLIAQRDQARAQYDRCFQIMMSVFSLIGPGQDFKAPDGTTRRFMDPNAAETLHHLSAAIKAIPEKLSAIATPASAAVPAAPLAQPFAWVTSNLKHIMFADRFENQGNPATAGMLPLYFGAPLVAQASPWMPIETAPKDGTSIMLYAPARTYEGEPVSARVAQGEWTEWRNTFGEYHGTTGEYLGQSVQDDGACWMSWDGGFLEELPPTHWQPLPTAPEASPLVEDAQRIVAGKVE